MKRLLVLGLVAAGCGDNSKACGPGTTDIDGYCTGSGGCGAGTKDDGMGVCVPDGSVVCTNGTIFDAASGTCVIDPGACQNGTVLIGAACVDPGETLTVDADEGPEPNGLGVLGEESVVPAGLVTIKSSGATVIHGHIVPVDRDGDGQRDPDVDAYLFTTTGPLLLHISVDGVHGLAGGFLVFANVSGSDPLGSWERDGVNLTGDTSQRDVYIPAAGQYVLAITDSRSLLVDAAAGADAGQPAFEYFASITAQPLPAPTQLTTTNGKVIVTGTLAPGGVAFYTVGLGTGFNDVLLDAPTGAVSASDAVKGALVLLDGTTVRGTATETVTSTGAHAAELTFAGAGTGPALVVVDTEFDEDLDPTPYRLTISTSTATPLSATGGTATATQATIAPAPPYTSLAWFSLDVGAANATTGLALSFTRPVDVVLVDARFLIISTFTWIQNRPTGKTMASYTGLLRFPAAGRYYFGVYDPKGAPGDAIVATSTYGTALVQSITENGSIQNSLIKFGAAAVDYDAGTVHPWQVFDISGTGTGAIRADFYLAGQAYGRLDNLQVDGKATPPDPTPILTHVFPETGGPIGRILLDDLSTHDYIHVTPATQDPTARWTFEPAPRDYTDLMALSTGGMKTTTDTLAPGESERLYLFRAPAGDRDSVAVTPGDLLGNLQFDVLAPDESPLQHVDNGGLGAADSATIIQRSRGWTALAIRNTGVPVGAQSYTLDLAVRGPISYTHATAATTLADACVGGTTRTLVATASVAGTDDGLTAPIGAPAGFTFFGVPAASFVVSSNGWLSLDVTTTDAAFKNADLPSPVRPNALVAPYWDDLDQVAICTKTIGTKVVVQWTGVTFDATHTAVQFQAILDGATGTIDFVYGPNQAALGASATIGIEDQAGVNAAKLGFDQSGTVAASSAQRFTPN